MSDGAEPTLCGACNGSIGSEKSIRCRQCKKFYHLEGCGTVTGSRLIDESADFKRASKRILLKDWTCTDCLAKVKLGAGNVNSPRSRANSYASGTCSSDEDTTKMMRSVKSVTDNLSSKHVSGTLVDIELLTKILDEKLDSKLNKFLANIESAVSSIKTRQNNMEKRQEELGKEFDLLTGRHSDIHDDLQDLKEKRMETDKIISSLTNENNLLRGEITLLRAHQETADQRSRSCNLDIQLVPERKGENLMQIVENIGALVGVPIPATSVVTVHRVAAGRDREVQATDRPRNIVVQLTTRRLRDEMIAAARTRRNLTTDQLKLGAPPTRFYINEHLTLKNKILYAETRSTARSKGYKYVWVRDGSIHVRKDDQSRAFTIRRQEDLLKI